MEPWFSIIIPTCNRPKRLACAVASVLEQNFSEWELIIIDDGSTPPVAQQASSRITVVRQANAGPGQARALGISLARGKYLCFLDDDDYYLPNHLAILAAASSSTTSAEQIYLSGVITLTVGGQRQPEALFKNDGQLLVQYWKRPCSLLPFCLPRALALDYPIPTEPSPIEDFEWLCHLLAVAPCQQLPNYTVVYVEHDVNRTNRLTSRIWLRRREEAIERLYALTSIRVAISWDTYCQMLTHQRLHWSRQCARAGQWNDALYGLSRGLQSANLSSVREILYSLLAFARAVMNVSTK